MNHQIEAKLIGPEILKSLPLPHWTPESSKDDYGKLLVIAGSRRLPGAAILAAKAALRTGCGTVRLACPQSVAVQIAVAVPELMVVPLPETDTGTIALSALEILQEQFAPCDAAIIGPGLDAHDETDELCRQIIKVCPLPLLIDAQALYAVGEELLEHGPNNSPRILTPHPGEVKAIMGKTLEEIGVSREEFATNFALREECVLVLKGRETLIAARGPQLFKNTAGTRGMGTAGSGDVLSGVIGALLAQGLETIAAGVWGVYLHAKAGELAAKILGDDGMMASDFLEQFPLAQRDLRKYQPPMHADERG